MLLPITYRPNCQSFDSLPEMHSSLSLPNNGDLFVGMRRELKMNIVKPALSDHSNRRTKISFQDRLSLNAGQKYCRMLQGASSKVHVRSNTL